MYVGSFVPIALPSASKVTPRATRATRIFSSAAVLSIAILLDVKSPFCRSWVTGKAWRLLQAGEAGIEADQGIENREDMAAVLHHTLEHFAQAGFALSLSVPASQHLRRHFDIP